MNLKEPIVFQNSFLFKNNSPPQLSERLLQLPRNLKEGLDALASDNNFLRRGDIFSDELLDLCVYMKRKEIKSIQTVTPPFEYKMYFKM
jgi:glutamine synthetase